MLKMYILHLQHNFDKVRETQNNNAESNIIPGNDFFMIRFCGYPIFVFPDIVYDRLGGNGGGLS